VAKIGAGTEQLYDTHIQNPNNAKDFCNGLKNTIRKTAPTNPGYVS
jgi:hypothetical protein